MYNKKYIKIESCSEYVGYHEIYTIEKNQYSISANQEIIIRMKNKNSETRELSDTELNSIEEAFDELDFAKIFKESGNTFGFDGCTLKCTIGRSKSELTVKLWSPRSNQDVPETTKLLYACNMVYDLFPKVED